MTSILKKINQKWINRFILLIYLSIIPIFLNGCFFNQPSEISGKMQGKLLFWHSLSGELMQIVNQGLQEFKQLNPDVNIVSEYIPEDELKLRFMQQSQAGLGASMVLLFSHEIPELVKAKHLKSLDSTDIDLSSYLPLTLNQVRYQNKIYGVPLGSEIQVLCYNQANLQTIQDPEDPFLSQPPTELDGLIERSQKGYSVGMVSSFQDTFWGIGIFGGSLSHDQGRIQTQFKGWEKWLDWLKKATIEPNFILHQNRNLLHNAFAQGKLTYYVCNSSEIIDFKNVLRDNLRIALLPQENQDTATPILYTRVMVFNRRISTKEFRLGLALAQFLTNPEQQLQGIVQTQSFIPSNKNLVLDEKLLPIQSLLVQQSKRAIAISLDDLESISSIFDQAEVLYQQAISGEISTAEASKKLTALINHSMMQK